jgi:hypothetical protein
MLSISLLQRASLSPYIICFYYAVGRTVHGFLERGFCLNKFAQLSCEAEGIREILSDETKYVIFFSVSQRLMHYIDVV